MSFLTRVKTENFDIGWRKHEWLMVIGLLSYDVEMGIKNFKSFFWFSRFAFGCTMNGWCHATCRSYMFLTKKKLWNIYDIRIVGGKVTLIPVVSSNDTTYSNVVSIPAENTTNIYMSYITTYPLSGACVFNAAQTMMYMLWERIQILSRDHKTSLGPHALGARSWLVARRTRSPYRTIETVLKQTSSWGDRYLPSYLVVGALLQKVNRC
jgi:hypothetical protein